MQNDAKTPAVQIVCAICGKPVDLRTCRTNADGKAVHPECLVQTLVA